MRHSTSFTLGTLSIFGIFGICGVAGFAAAVAGCGLELETDQIAAGLDGHNEFTAEFAFAGERLGVSPEPSVDVLKTSEGSIFGTQVDACSIEYLAPFGAIRADEDSSTPGLQFRMRVAVDASCIGLTASTTCGIDTVASAVIPDDGVVDFMLTGCALEQCESSYACDTRVELSGGASAGAPRTIDVDSIQLPVALWHAPELECGDLLTNEFDTQLVDGVQIEARVMTPVSGYKWIRQVVGDSERWWVTDHSGATHVTLLPGRNVLSAVLQSGGEAGISSACAVDYMGF